MTDAQTEARAIAARIEKRVFQAEQARQEMISADLNGWPNAILGLIEAAQDAATALAAKDAELAAVKALIDGDNCADPDKIDALFRRAERAEAQLAAYRQSAVHPDDHDKVLAQLAEARKALDEIIEKDRAELKILEYGRTYTQEHDGPFAKIARRAREAQGGD